MIRNFKQTDIEDIMKIWLESSIKAHDFINKQYWLDNYEIVKTKYIPEAETFVYEEDKKILGFISILNKNYVGALFVNNDNTKKGIGSCLIEHVKDKYSRLNLNVYADNINAVDFYKKHDFKIINEGLDESTNRCEFTMEYNK